MSQLKLPKRYKPTQTDLKALKRVEWLIRLRLAELKVERTILEAKALELQRNIW